MGESRCAAAEDASSYFLSWWERTFQAKGPLADRTLESLRESIT